MVIDFRTKKHTPDSVVLKGSDVERVSVYKYLGIVMDDKLSWHPHVDFLVKRLNVRMYCLRKLILMRTQEYSFYFMILLLLAFGSIAFCVGVGTLLG